MSEEKEKGLSLEKENKVVISPDDVNAALDFWKHFNVPITDEMQESFSLFAKDPSFENQQKLKLEVCKAISLTDHPAFKDEMFVKIAEECANISFNMQFDKDFEVTVSEKE
jgi:hypothetical protein